MGYRIEYGPGVVRWTDNRIRPGRVAGYTAVCLALFGLLAGICWPERTSELRDMLLPGDPAVTRQALVDLAQQLREGETVVDAVTVFCREIIDEAQTSD